MSLRQKFHEWMEMDVNGWYGEAVGESKPRAARLGIPGENPTPTVRVFIKSTGLGQRLSIGYTMNLLFP